MSLTAKAWQRQGHRPPNHVPCTYWIFNFSLHAVFWSQRGQPPCRAFTPHDVSGFWCASLAGCLKELPPIPAPWCSVAALPAGLWANRVPVCSSFPEQLNPSEISRKIIQSDLQCTWYFCGCSCADLASACVSPVRDMANSKSTVPVLCLGRACPTVGQIQLAAIMFPSQGPFSKKPYILLFIPSYVRL